MKASCAAPSIGTAFQWLHQQKLDRHDDGGKTDGVGENAFDAQLEQTIANIDRVLLAGGSSRDQIVKVTIYLTDMGNFPKIVDARKKSFIPPYPADTIVEVKALALPELMVEIDVIAAA